MKSDKGKTTMRKNLFPAIMTIVVLLIPVSASAQDGNDKAKHFVISAALGGIGESIFHHATGMSPIKRITAGALVACVPPLIKEIRDEGQKNNSFSKRDMAADIAGAFTGSVLANFVNNRIKVHVTKRKDETKVAVVYKF